MIQDIQQFSQQIFSCTAQIIHQKRYVLLQIHLAVKMKYLAVWHVYPWEISSHSLPLDKQGIYSSHLQMLQFCPSFSDGGAEI